MANTYSENGKLYLQCSTCWDYKELNEINFRKNSNKRWFLWFRSQCRECERERMRKYVHNNSEHLREYKKNYEETHKERRKEYNKRYNESHVEEIRFIKKVWQEKKRDYIYEQRKEYMIKYFNTHPRKQYQSSMGLSVLHSKTSKYVRGKWIRPTKCSICNAERRIVSHHPNNDIWNEIVWCCDRCHRLIHSWYLECPKPIDLLNMQ